LPLGCTVRRRGRRRFLAGLLVLASLAAATGCGVGRTIPLESGSDPNPPASPVTPAGTYTIAATATSAGLTRTVNLTLIVQ
jgi:hypothetical protein